VDYSVDKLHLLPQCIILSALGWRECVAPVVFGTCFSLQPTKQIHRRKSFLRRRYVFSGSVNCSPYLTRKVITVFTIVRHSARRIQFTSSSPTDLRSVWILPFHLLLRLTIRPFLLVFPTDTQHKFSCLEYIQHPPLHRSFSKRNFCYTVLWQKVRTDELLLQIWNITSRAEHDIYRETRAFIHK